MPEGHTLHRLAREQNRRFAGQPIRVSSPQGRFVEGAAVIDGAVLDRVSAYGKHLFAHFGDQVVHVHLGLFGKYTSGTGTAPEPRGALRMRWQSPDAWSDLRGPTACEVLTRPEAKAIVARLGPDPLARKPNGDRAYERIRRSRAPIAALLMDQKVLAGVGNVYRAEVLFRQRVPPHLPGRDLSAEAWSLMWQDLVVLMRAGLRAGRILTTRPEDRQRRSGRARRVDSHYVYRRAGERCRWCGTPIRMELLAMRKLYWCPVCQSGTQDPG